MIKSDRQEQLAELVAEGLSNKEIAARTGLALSTVKTYLEEAYRKTGSRNRTGLAIWHIKQIEEDIKNAKTTLGVTDSVGVSGLLGAAARRA